MIPFRCAKSAKTVEQWRNCKLGGNLRSERNVAIGEFGGVRMTRIRRPNSHRRNALSRVGHAERRGPGRLGAENNSDSVRRSIRPPAPKPLQGMTFGDLPPGRSRTFLARETTNPGTARGSSQHSGQVVAEVARLQISDLSVLRTAGFLAGKAVAGG